LENGSLNVIKSLKNEQGYVYALITYDQQDKDHIFIKECWIHENYRNNGCIPKLVREMINDEKTHDTDFVGWERETKGKDFKWYPVHRILRILYKIKGG
jgi:hypothetical protein